jgi:hypothetical protein
LDKKKPVIWTGDLNVAPTEKGSVNVTCLVYHGRLTFGVQTFAMLRRTGTSNQDILKQKQHPSNAF